MEIDEKMMKDAMNGAVEKLKENLVSNLRDSISWQVEEAAKNQVMKFVTEWIAKNLLPEIEAELIVQKDGLRKISVNFASEVVEQLSKSLSDQLASKLSNSFSREKIFKTMFDAF